MLKLLVRDLVTGRIGTYQTAFANPNLMRELQRMPISTVVLSGQRVPVSAAIHEVQAAGGRPCNPARSSMPGRRSCRA